jgi:hypothetical protein
LKKGNSFLPSHEIKRLRAAMQLVSFWTSLTQRGGPISVIARISLVLALIPWWLTKKPSSCPDGTPKTHLFRLSFHFHFFKFSKFCFKYWISIVGSFAFTTTSSM